MKVFVYAPHAKEYCRRIRERIPELEVVSEKPGEDQSRDIADAEIMIAWQFPLEILGKASRLRWIQLTSAGVDQLLEARDRLKDVIVTNTRGIHIDAMADYALGAMVMLQRNFARFFLHQQHRKWSRRITEPLAGKTLGIVGVGAVGREIARRAQIFGMSVIGVKRNPAPTEMVSRLFGPDRLDEMLSLSDFVVLSVPATPETYRMIGESELRTMKETCYLINISRGSVVDESALIQALQQKWIAGAVLDVFEKEPLPRESPLWALENVIITPHIAGDFEGYVERVIRIFSENFAQWKSDNPLINEVDLAKGY